MRSVLLFWGASLVLAMVLGALLRRAFPHLFVRIRFDSGSRGTPAEMAVIEAIARRRDIAALASCPTEIYIVVHDLPLAGRKVRDAYEGWPEEHLAGMSVGPGFPSLRLDAVLAGNCRKVTFSIMRYRAGGMGAWHGFYGYQLVTIVDLDTGRILDCRGEEACG